MADHRFKRQRVNGCQETIEEDSTVGIAFDIEGSIKIGGKWDPESALAIQRVINNEIPHVFISNGGWGKTEEEYAAEISVGLSNARAEVEPNASLVKVDAKQVVLSYSPWLKDLAHLKDESILCVGIPREGVKNVMKSYGFTKAVHIQDYDAVHPLMNPFKNENTKMDTSKETWKEGFKAVCVLTDPPDYYEALQLVTDVLLSSRPGEVEFEKDHLIPIYFSNPDLLSKFKFANARFAQGAFQLALRELYTLRLHSLGADPTTVERRMKMWIQYGKPTALQYRFAMQRMLEQASATGERRIRRYYMVGDNPTSDMQGCVNMNEARGQLERWSHVLPGALNLPDISPWSGVLVRTGVYKDGDDVNGAIVVVNDVAESVDWIFRDSKLTCPHCGR